MFGDGRARHPCCIVCNPSTFSLSEEINRIRSKFLLIPSTHKDLTPYPSQQGLGISSREPHTQEGDTRHRHRLLVRDALDTCSVEKLNIPLCSPPSFRPQQTQTPPWPLCPSSLSCHQHLTWSRRAAGKQAAQRQGRGTERVTPPYTNYKANAIIFYQQLYRECAFCLRRPYKLGRGPQSVPVPSRQRHEAFGWRCARAGRGHVHGPGPTRHRCEQGEALSFSKKQIIHSIKA